MASTTYLVKAADGRTTTTRSSKKGAIDWFSTDADAVWIETNNGKVVHGTRPVEFEPAVIEAAEPLKPTKPKRTKVITPEGIKHCSFCNEDKQLSEFYNGKARCKPCYKEYAAAWHAARKAVA